MDYEYERGIASVRAQLGEAPFATVYAEGQMMTLDRASGQYCCHGHRIARSRVGRYPFGYEDIVSNTLL